MKNIVKIGAALTALLIATSNAFAGWGGVVQDLTISNNLNATTTTLSGYPTNGATTGTNGLYIATGNSANEQYDQPSEKRRAAAKLFHGLPKVKLFSSDARGE